MQYISIGFSSFPRAGTGDVWFSLRGTTYQNNSCVALEDIGEDDTALFCMTNFTSCCPSNILENWFFPNGSTIPSVMVTASSSQQRDIYITRGPMVVRFNRRRGGVEGIYHCKIPDSRRVFQTIYIGVYTANTSTGE